MKSVFSQSNRWWPRVLTAVAGGAVVAFYVAVDPTEVGWLPRCWWMQLTGTPCPSCGMQRALYAALHGHWAEALAYNYFLGVVVVVVALIVLSDVLPWPALRRVTHHKAVLPAVMLTMLGWWIVRNLLGV